MRNSGYLGRLNIQPIEPTPFDLSMMDFRDNVERQIIRAMASMNLYGHYSYECVLLRPVLGKLNGMKKKFVKCPAEEATHVATSCGRIKMLARDRFPEFILSSGQCYGSPTLIEALLGKDCWEKEVEVEPTYLRVPDWKQATHIRFSEKDIRPFSRDQFRSNGLYIHQPNDRSHVTHMPHYTTVEQLFGRDCWMVEAPDEPAEELFAKYHIYELALMGNQVANLAMGDGVVVSLVLPKEYVGKAVDINVRAK